MCIVLLLLFIYLFIYFSNSIFGLMLTHACSPEVGLLQDVIKCDINNLRSEHEERLHVPRSQMVHTQYLLHYIVLSAIIAF